jgi:hypothetical protein
VEKNIISNEEKMKMTVFLNDNIDIFSDLFSNGGEIAYMIREEILAKIENLVNNWLFNPCRSYITEIRTIQDEIINNLYAIFSMYTPTQYHIGGNGMLIYKWTEDQKRNDVLSEYKIFAKNAIDEIYAGYKKIECLLMQSYHI